MYAAPQYALSVTPAVYQAGVGDAVLNAARWSKFYVGSQELRGVSDYTVWNHFTAEDPPAAADTADEVADGADMSSQFPSQLPLPAVWNDVWNYTEGKNMSGVPGTVTDTEGNIESKEGSPYCSSLSPQSH